MNMNYPFKWVPVSPELEAKRRQLFGEASNQYNGVVSDPMGINACPLMEKVAKRIYEFKVRPDDVWIVTYPKCGTTWTQELVWQIMNGLKVQEARDLPLFVRSPFIECEGLYIEEAMEPLLRATEESGNEKEKMTMQAYVNSIETAEKAASPRVIKSHFPIEMLPPNLLDSCKVIFVSRNPKDCCVSFYHHYRNFKEYDYQGDFANFAEMFMEGSLEYGSYWTTLKSAWKLKDHPNLKILWYEDMKKDLIGVIREVCKFLGKHMTELKILQLDDHLYIDNFREIITEGFGGDPTIRDFIRKGKVGDWKNYFNEERKIAWDKWISNNLEGTDIVLPED